MKILLYIYTVLYNSGSRVEYEPCVMRVFISTVVILNSKNDDVRFFLLLWIIRICNIVLENNMKVLVGAHR